MSPRLPGKSSLNGVLFSISVCLCAEGLLSNLSAVENELAPAGRMGMLFLAFYALFYFATVSFPRFKNTLGDIFVLTGVTVGTIFLVWFGEVVGIGITTYPGTAGLLGAIRAESLFFAIPFATGALILQALMGRFHALLGTLVITTVVGIYLPKEAVFVPFTLVTSLTASLSLQRFRSRSAYIKAGLNISLVSIPFALASMLIGEDLIIGDFVVRIAGAVFGGIICTFIAAGATPIIESLGGYVTDMRLIEMATLDHPLLKELSIQAPGTWNHSMVMGMMVESAADGVGANAVLARVGAYFHDIGKMKKPLYFVENQLESENRHDKLSPSMSALIIRSHVKDGMELAKQHRLPGPIVDMIPQHHGTSVIEYFYDKAKKESEDAGSETEVDITLYTYPGPKPQTREAGILMLADGIEAAARTLREPNLDRIQGLVQKMINKIFRSGQLNECELTLKDLHLIAKCFVRVLNGIYHQRIAYAEPAEKVANTHENSTESEKAKGEKTLPSKKNGSSLSEDPDEEGLKRLGQDEDISSPPQKSS